MTSTVEERLVAYREVLEEAVDARRRVVRPVAAGRRWRLLAPLLGAIAAATLGLVLVIRDVHPAVAPGPADTAVAPSGPTTPSPSASAAPTSTPVPPATTAAAPVATPAGAPVPALAIGDSVMLGAAGQLGAGGVVVDAAESRVLADVIPFVEQMRDAGVLGDAVVVHLGTNGPLAADDVNELFTSLVAVPDVIVLTVHGSREYAAENNAELAALPAHFPNVTVIDWDRLAAGCPGTCFYDDGIHLRTDGQTYYAGLILQALGQAATLPAATRELLQFQPATFDSPYNHLLEQLLGHPSRVVRAAVNAARVDVANDCLAARGIPPTAKSVRWFSGVGLTRVPTGFADAAIQQLETSTDPDPTGGHPELPMAAQACWQQAQDEVVDPARLVADRFPAAAADNADVDAAEEAFRQCLAGLGRTWEPDVNLQQQFSDQAKAVQRRLVDPGDITVDEALDQLRAIRAAEDVDRQQVAPCTDAWTAAEQASVNRAQQAALDAEPELAAAPDQLDAALARLTRHLPG